MAAKASAQTMQNAITMGHDTRLFLLFGTDESLAEDIARSLAGAMGPGAERVDMDTSDLKNDPARLLDEAASISLFGEKRYIRLRIQSDSALAAIENLLEAAEAGNPVIATAGNLTKANKLRKLAESHPKAVALACYPPDAAQAIPFIQERARAKGLDLARPLAQRIFAATNGDRILATSELEKLALYLDASPEAPKTVDLQAVTDLGAETSEENIGALVHITLSGETGKLGAELEDARALGLNAVRIIKAFQRRVSQLVPLASDIDNGASIEQTVEGARQIFFKEKNDFKRELGLWNSPRLARLNQRLVALEQMIMSTSSSAHDTLLSQELLEICRAASSKRRYA